MIVDRQQALNSVKSPDCETVNSKWIQNNKYSSSKWKRLAIDLHLLGFTVKIYKAKATNSTYITVINKNKAMKIAIRNHHIHIGNNKYIKKQIIRNRKFGNISLIVGFSGVSTNDAYYIIKDTLREN